MDLKAVGQRIKAAREAKNLTQEELAALVNLSPTHVSVIERGLKVTKLDTFIAIANALDVSADTLLIDVVAHSVTGVTNELTEKISVQQGDLLHGTEGKADIIIANIIADIIIMLLQDIPGKLKSGGIFLASGIIEERQNDVSAAASKVGLCVEAVDAKGGWVVMQMRKED